MFKRAIAITVLVALGIGAGYGQSADEHARPGVVPLHKFAAGQWVENVWGDTRTPGELFSMRIHNDAGYIVLPHVHPMDENIIVVKGDWWFGMGGRFDRSALHELESGTFGFGPRNMPHFAWSKTETITHIYGIGPFDTKLVDPVYELTSEGTFMLTSLLQPGTPAQPPPGCFALNVGARVTGPEGEGSVVAARCSPANQITQYWIQKANGERFWSRLEALKHS